MSVTDLTLQTIYGREVPDVRIDYDANDNAIYQGWAVPGTATSAPRWLMVKRTYDGSNRVTYMQTIINGVWDNRTTAF